MQNFISQASIGVDVEYIVIDGGGTDGSCEIFNRGTRHYWHISCIVRYMIKWLIVGEYSVTVLRRERGCESMIGLGK